MQAKRKRFPTANHWGRLARLANLIHIVRRYQDSRKMILQTREQEH